MFTLRAMDQETFSPAAHYQVLRAESKRRGSEESLWCSEQGKPYKRVDNIRKFLAKILKDANIPEICKPYSIRHAVITALFQAGFDEKQVNAYTGHSNNSHTALNYYYHLDRAWAGKTLAELGKPIAVTPKIQAAIDRDHEEGGNEDKEDFELDAKNLFGTEE
jgi:site-specific recombinase XerD